MTMTNRERLQSLLELLDDAPFEVDQLRQQVVAATRELPDNEAGEVLKQTLRELTQAQADILTGEAQVSQESETHYAIDWLATARATLQDYTIN